MRERVDVASLVVPPTGQGRSLYYVPGEMWIEEAPSCGDERNPDAFPRLAYSTQKDRDRDFTDPVLADKSGPCLSEFIRLCDGAPDQFSNRVLAFARRRGTLGICRHRMLSSHSRCSPLDPNIGAGKWEPIEAWLRYVRNIRALMNIGERLRNGNPGDPSDWAAVEAVTPSEKPFDVGYGLFHESEERQAARAATFSWVPPPEDMGDVAGERGWLGWALGRWLKLGEVQLQTSWWTDAPQIRLRYGALRGVIAIQLAAALISPQGLYQCAGCGHPFAPLAGSRRPQRGKRAWCPTCGRLAQWRAYQKGHYQSKKSRKGADHGETGK